MNPRYLGTWTSRSWTSRYWTVRDLDETIFLTDHNCLVLINCQYFCTSSSLIYMNQKCFLRQVTTGHFVDHTPLGIFFNLIKKNHF